MRPVSKLNAMKHWRLLVASYLVLCLAFAGAIGLSPVLHYWIEHGGQGPIHSHSSFVSHVTWGSHSHTDGQFHSQVRPQEDHSPAGFFVHNYRPFALPNISLSGLFHALCHLFEGLGPVGSPQPLSSENGGHVHNSLPQMLASGCVEQALDIPLISFTPGSFLDPGLLGYTLFLPKEWNAQTASRGPPAIWN